MVGFSRGRKSKVVSLAFYVLPKNGSFTERKHIFPLSKAVCGVKGRACVPSTRVQIGPRLGYQGCFHRSFEWAERGLEKRKKIKSLFYEHRKEICPGLNSKQGLAGSRPGVKTLECEDARQCLVCPLPKTQVIPARDGSAVGASTGSHSTPDCLELRTQPKLPFKSQHSSCPVFLSSGSVG